MTTFTGPLVPSDVFKITLPGTATVNDAGEVVADLSGFVGGAISATTLTASGAVAFADTLAVAGASALHAVSATGAISATTTIAAGTTVTGGTGVIATTGGVTASAGNIVATLGNITASAGNITATLGTLTIGGRANLSGGIRSVLPTYADNAAALLGGLVATDLYKTATGELRIVV
jgi:hypothetical protein